MGVPSWNGGGSGASLIVEPDEKQAQKQEAGRSLRNFSENIHGGLTGFVLLIEELSFIGGAIRLSYTACVPRPEGSGCDGN